MICRGFSQNKEEKENVRFKLTSPKDHRVRKSWQDGKDLAWFLKGQIHSDMYVSPTQTSEDT